VHASASLFPGPFAVEKIPMNRTLANVSASEGHLVGAEKGAVLPGGYEQEAPSHNRVDGAAMEFIV
jgi:hypothetical protein